MCKFHSPKMNVTSPHRMQRQYMFIISVVKSSDVYRLVSYIHAPPLKADSSSTSLTCMHVWPSMMHIATTLLRQCYAPKGHALYRMHASNAYRHTSCRSWVMNTHGHAHSFKISTFLTFCNVLYTLLFTHCESEYQHVMEL